MVVDSEVRRAFGAFVVRVFYHRNKKLSVRFHRFSVGPIASPIDVDSGKVIPGNPLAGIPIAVLIDSDAEVAAAVQLLVDLER